MVKLGSGVPTNADKRGPGRPKGSPNKTKPVTANKPQSEYTGTYGRLDTNISIEILPNTRYRVFSSGNVGFTNLRFNLVLNPGTDAEEKLLVGPVSPTILIARDDQWRKDNNSVNKNAALHVSELDGWEEAESKMELIQECLGKLNKSEED